MLGHKLHSVWSTGFLILVWGTYKIQQFILLLWFLYVSEACEIPHMLRTWMRNIFCGCFDQKISFTRPDTFWIYFIIKIIWSKRKLQWAVNFFVKFFRIIFNEILFSDSQDEIWVQKNKQTNRQIWIDVPSKP